jgi:CDGSH-type Zn-finger protein
VPPKVNLVHVRENGPLAFHGEVTIDGHGQSFRSTLCRCGKSANKPFCDHAHAREGFAATGEAPTLDSQVLARRDGPITITPLADGPLAITGNLEVVSGTGRTINRCVRTALCRCGGSQSKPFCDGTHAKIGFRAPSGTPTDR